MNKKFIIGILLLLILGVGVSLYNKKSQPSEIILEQLQRKSTIVPLDSNEAKKLRILGDDFDNDGIRDDVYNKIIAASLDSEQKREAMKQLAKSFQPYLVAVTREEAIAANKIRNKANSCIYFLYDNEAYDIITLVKTFILDTEDRLRAYFNSQKLQGTTTGTKYSNPCEFDLSSLRN